MLFLLNKSREVKGQYIGEVWNYSQGMDGRGRNIKVEIWVAESTNIQFVRIRLKTAYLNDVF